MFFFGRIDLRFFPESDSTAILKCNRQNWLSMTYTIQEAAGTLFNAAEVPEQLIEPLKGYVQVITTSPKNSVKYYTEEEHSEIPGWKLLRTVRIVPKYGETFSLAIFNRIWKLVDRRAPICFTVDDFVCQRYGKKAYRCNYFYSNAHGGIVWGNALVDTTLRNGNLVCPVTFEIHQKKGPLKLWERGLAQIQQLVMKCLEQQIDPNRIWTLGDCVYGNVAMEYALRNLGVFYLLGLPKNRQVELFGRKQSLAQYFTSHPDRSLTVAGQVYRYKLSTANLNGWGRRRLLAFYGPGNRWRYYACNKLDATAKTLLLRRRDRWTVEDTHRSLKNYHGAEHFHVWKKPAVLGHFQLAYLSCALTSLERTNRRKKGEYCTQEMLHREAIRWSRQN